jgi:hypothetical protein
VFRGVLSSLFFKKKYELKIKQKKKKKSHIHWSKANMLQSRRSEV